MKIIYTIQEMASDEILAAIPEDLLKQIKETDKNPTFKAFAVVHEGESTGKLIGVGNVVKKWFRSAIEKVHEIMPIGLEVFHGHNQDNSKEGRTIIGKIAGKIKKTIDGALTSIGIIYMKPEFAKEKLDAPSIEAEVWLDEKAEIHNPDVREVTGIALVNKDLANPGFPNAGLLAQMQAYIKKDVIEPKKEELTFSQALAKNAVAREKRIII